MRKIKILLLGFIVLLFAHQIIAQTIETEVDTSFKEVTNVVERTSSTAEPVTNAISELSPMSSLEFWLSLIVLGFGMLIIGLEVVLIIKKRIGAEHVIKFIIVTLIITSAMFLITAGYDNNQIAPAMGLLGTIAGYLLGKSDGEMKEGKIEDKTENELKTTKSE